jgi:hypothetical protein
MPYQVAKVEGGFKVKNTETGEMKPKKAYKTRSEAVDFMKTLQSAEDLSKNAPPTPPMAPEMGAGLPSPTSNPMAMMGLGGPGAPMEDKLRQKPNSLMQKLGM